MCEDVFFFFSSRRRHTRSLCDWSSDVCSSDLKVLESDPQRRIDVQWEDGKGTPRPVRVEVTCVDQPGLLAAMSKAISSAGINITRAQVHALGDHKAQNVFELSVASAY